MFLEHFLNHFKGILSITNKIELPNGVLCIKNLPFHFPTITDIFYYNSFDILIKNDCPFVATMAFIDNADSTGDLLIISLLSIALPIQQYLLSSIVIVADCQQYLHNSSFILPQYCNLTPLPFPFTPKIHIFFIWQEMSTKKNRLIRFTYNATRIKLPTNSNKCRYQEREKFDSTRILLAFSGSPLCQSIFQEVNYWRKCILV